MGGCWPNYIVSDPIFTCKQTRGEDCHPPEQNVIILNPKLQKKNKYRKLLNILQSVSVCQIFVITLYRIAALRTDKTTSSKNGY